MHTININKEFNFALVENIIEFIEKTHIDIIDSQNIKFNQSKNIIIGSIEKIYLKCEYETTLELHFEFIYGNKNKAQIEHEVVSTNSFYKNINPLFLKQQNIANILDLFELFYIKQDYKVREALSLKTQESIIISQDNIDYKKILKDDYPIYEQKLLNKKIEGSLPVNTLKMKI